MGRLDKLYKTDVPHRAKLVYIYLHDRMDKERKAWPGLNTIASHLSLSRSTVKQSRQGFRESRSNRYYLL